MHYRYSWNGVPACTKVQALLHYYEQPYDLIEVDRATKVVNSMALIVFRRVIVDIGGDRVATEWI